MFYAQDGFVESRGGYRAFRWVFVCHGLEDGAVIHLFVPNVDLWNPEFTVRYLPMMAVGNFMLASIVGGLESVSGFLRIRFVRQPVD